ncbi:MAG: hypothetical protein LAN84_02305 [Acidobacteriia bacterium]|nr:hypothetical protein [Terriglobia bacterium]
MIAAAILVLSLGALVQFFISYSRSLVAAAAAQPLSVETQEVAGISTSARGEDFARLLQLLELCPERPHDRGEIRAVRSYFRLVSALRWSLARLLPSLQPWMEAQRAQCAYFAAVALDRRIAFSRGVLAAQLDNSR